MAMIKDGYVLLARAIQQSPIWMCKPSWWLKVWLFILMRANHQGNKSFDRGQNFFTFEMIHYKCSLASEGVKRKSVDNVVRWLRERGDVTTQKTTRGIIITVSNYESYQSGKSYKNDTGNGFATTDKRHYKQEGKNEKNVYSSEVLEIINDLNEVTGASYRSTTAKTISLIQARI